MDASLVLGGGVRRRTVTKHKGVVNNHVMIMMVMIMLLLFPFDPSAPTILPVVYLYDPSVRTIGIVVTIRTYMRTGSSLHTYIHTYILRSDTTSTVQSTPYCSTHLYIYISHGNPHLALFCFFWRFIDRSTTTTNSFVRSFVSPENNTHK